MVASPGCLQSCRPPEAPKDLLDHPLLAFWRREPEASWTFVHKDGRAKETITFRPYLAMNDFAGLTPALIAVRGIDELPPVVHPELLRTGRLVEVMPDWRFPPFDLSLIHLGNRHLSKQCRESRRALIYARVTPIVCTVAGAATAARKSRVK